ncbi:cytochrome p450 2j2 [Plakobranchus ocellatus]|uniref:Cytochrome p450 2j2 n=1 Tax=Plakobranchus ocellatus TaxID=259542 RepID=A0AAV4E012_9GAST|nr:cytochrome p450 2j2 [Plakobranchus ocellatus]
MIGFGEATGVMWAVLTVMIGLFVYWTWSQLKPKYTQYNIPPFPGKKTFLLGHLPAWMKADELDSMKHFREKAGDIFSLDLAGNLVVVVSGYDAVKEVMVNRFNEAPDRTTEPSGHAIGEAGLGILNAEGEVWKEERATTIAILRSFGMGQNILAEKIEEEVSIFIEKIAHLKGEPVDFKFLMTTSIANIICSIAVGKRFGHDDPYFVKLMENLLFQFKRAPGYSFNTVVGIADLLPFDLFGIKTWIDNIRAIRQNFCVAHIKEAKKDFIKGETSVSFITSYLEKMREETEKNSSSSLSEENLIATIRSLFIAGAETTGSTIYWCVLLCLHNPEVQDKVYEEITEHVGNGRRVTIRDKPKLPFLEAVIRETQRYASILSALPRKVIKTFQMNGYTIPKDTLILLNMYSTHHDAKTWGDPEKFRPERFLDAKGNLIHQEELVPFGLGKHACPGEAMAKMELFIYLSSLLQRFRFEPENSTGELPSLKGFVTVVRVPERYKVRFVERSVD